MKQTLLDWLKTFWKVIVSPTPKTFLKEAKKANGKFPSALGWLVAYAVYLIAISSIAQQRIISFPTMLTALILIPLSVSLFTSVLNFICQRMFRQKAYIYDKLLYMTISILLPGFVIFVPFAGLMSPEVFATVSFTLLLYQIGLLVMAVKTIVEIELWQALLATTLSIMAGILIGLVIFILIVSTISPPELNQ